MATGQRFVVALCAQSRPELGFLSPGANIVLSGTPSLNSGNPLLEPIRATTYDAAIE